MSWSAGDVVFKPVDVDDLEELAWQAQIFSQIPSVGFRLARPRGLPTARCASMDGAPLSM
jgi:hypothetical protein